jgi:hypothetical protein
MVAETGVRRAAVLVVLASLASGPQTRAEPVPLAGELPLTREDVEALASGREPEQLARALAFFRRQQVYADSSAPVGPHHKLYLAPQLEPDRAYEQIGEQVVATELLELLGAFDELTAEFGIDIEWQWRLSVLGDSFAADRIRFSESPDAERAGMAPLLEQATDWFEEVTAMLTEADTVLFEHDTAWSTELSRPDSRTLAACATSSACGSRSHRQVRSGTPRGFLRTVPEAGYRS